MDRVELIKGLSANNPILAQLLEDWIDISSYSFWRFFPNEKSLRMWDKIIREVIANTESPHLLMYKSDVIGMILVLDHCVVRTYRTAKYLKIKPLYRLRNPYLEKCIMSRQSGHFGVFVCKKIKPLVDIETLSLSMKITPQLFEQMLQDIGRAMNKMHSYGYCHNDVSLDNTGYDEETGRFVLFDFDAATRMTMGNRKMCIDRTRWENSLRVWSKFLPIMKL